MLQTQKRRGMMEKKMERYGKAACVLYHFSQQVKRKESDTMTIKEARKQVGLTQQALSDWLGIPKRTIEDWEGGKRNCPGWCEKLVVEKILTYNKEQ